MWRSGFIFFFLPGSYCKHGWCFGLLFYSPHPPITVFKSVPLVNTRKWKHYLSNPVSKHIPQKSSLEDCFLVAGLSWWGKVAVSFECELDLDGIFVRQNVLERVFGACRLTFPGRGLSLPCSFSFVSCGEGQKQNFTNLLRHISYLSEHFLSVYYSLTSWGNSLLARKVVGHGPIYHHWCWKQWRNDLNDPLGYAQSSSGDFTHARQSKHWLMFVSARSGGVFEWRRG